jgi:ParB family chromosome partitioning protein
MTKQSLGRGLDSLIPQNFSLNDIIAPGEQIKQMPIEQLIINPFQPRKIFDEVAIKELADSIKQHGIIQPLVVTPHEATKFRIVAGERRYRAAKIAGLDKLPVIVRNHEELEELEVSLVENVQRVDLSPLEQAISIVRLRDQFSMSTKEIAAKLGKAETTISNIVRLLQLPPDAITALQKNEISEGHGRAILALKTDEEAQKELLNKIITQKISVREAEQFVHQKLGKSENKKLVNSQYALGLLTKVNINLQPKVKIKQSENHKGSVRISYSSNEELEQIIERLK